MGWRESFCGLAVATLVAFAAFGAAHASADRCERALKAYDRAVVDFSSSRDTENLTLAAPIERTAQAATRAKCLLRAEAMDGLPRLAAEIARERTEAPVGPGAAIRSTRLQAGVVAGVVAELQARNFFGALGYRVRSQGAPGLGRRIFLGPFTDAAALAEAVAIARRAGFPAPYPALF